MGEQQKNRAINPRSSLARPRRPLWCVFDVAISRDSFSYCVAENANVNLQVKWTCSFVLVPADRVSTV